MIGCKLVSVMMVLVSMSVRLARISARSTVLENVSSDNGDNYVLCRAYYPRDLLPEPVHLPGSIQLKPSSAVQWNTYWNLLNASDQPVGCLMIEGNETRTVLRSSASPTCAQEWKNVVFWPAFRRSGGHWENRYTMFLFAMSDVLTVQLNQKHSLTHITNELVSSLERVNATNGGPIIQFSSHLPRILGNCSFVPICSNGWSLLSVAPMDTVQLLLQDTSQDFVQIKVLLSKCFPEYKIGLYISPQNKNESLNNNHGSNSDANALNHNNSKHGLSTSHENEDVDVGATLRNLQAQYSRKEYYHTLQVAIDSQIILSETVPHRRLNCANDWFLITVKGARITSNCPHSATWRPKKSIFKKPITPNCSHSVTWRPKKFIFKKLLINSGISIQIPKFILGFIVGIHILFLMKN